MYTYIRHENEQGKNGELVGIIIHHNIKVPCKFLEALLTDRRTSE